MKESLEKFARFPISTSFEKGEPRLLLVAVDVQEATPVVFDSYEKEDGTRKSEYGRYGRMKSNGSVKNQDNEAFEYIIRYEEGIKSDFVLASCSIPVNYDYARLNVETRTLAVERQGDDAATDDSSGLPSHSKNYTSLRSFWDGGLLANTPLRQTYIAHIDYWRRVRKLEENVPSLRFSIINLPKINFLRLKVYFAIFTLFIWRDDFTFCCDMLMQMSSSPANSILNMNYYPFKICTNPYTSRCTCIYHISNT